MKKLLPTLVGMLFAISACSNEPGETESAAQTEDDIVAEIIIDEEAVTEEQTLETEEVVTEIAATSESEGDEAVDTSNEILLAVADEPIAPPQPSKYSEGRHYNRMSPVQPTSSSPEKIEVAEVFMFSCPHCYNFEPHLAQWREDMDPNVSFVRIPANFNALAEVHMYAYYTAVELGIAEEIVIPFFREFHVNRNPLNSEERLVEFFAEFDISEDQFVDTFNSIEVYNKVKAADRLVKQYRITSVPAVVINGKYKSGADLTGGYENLLEMVDELAASEMNNR